MSKYIDKDELWERLRKRMVHHIVTNTLFNTIKAVIDGMPTFEVSEDCISREWLLNYTHAEDVGTPDEMWKPAREWVNAIKNAPSVVPSRAEGEWKRHPIPESRAWDVCTACGTGCRRRHYGFNEDGTEWVEQANYPFCPNCGAKMRLE